METAVLISEQEYLATNYDPDCEWIEGVVTERNLGEYDHGNLQGAVYACLRSRRREWNIRVVPEQRIRVSATRYRIPDVCVLSRNQAIEPVFTKPPLLVIEVLSKDDSLRSYRDRIHDYRTFGIPNIWILDPVERKGYICVQGIPRESENGILRIDASPIQIDLNDLFADLD